MFFFFSPLACLAKTPTCATITVVQTKLIRTRKNEGPNPTYKKGNSQESLTPTLTVLEVTSSKHLSQTLTGFLLDVMCAFFEVQSPQ